MQRRTRVLKIVRRGTRVLEIVRRRTGVLKIVEGRGTRVDKIQDEVTHSRSCLGCLLGAAMNHNYHSSNSSSPLHILQTITTIQRIYQSLKEKIEAKYIKHQTLRAFVWYEEQCTMR